MPRTYDIAVLKGDGIGPEVTDEGWKVLTAAGRLFGFELAGEEFDLGADRYLRDGHVIDAEDLERLAVKDAILFGAMGDPRVRPGVLERGLILKIRGTLEQSINLRPVRLYPGVPSPIVGLTPERCDLVIIRENSEGMYASGGSTLYAGSRRSVAVQESINTRSTIERLIDFSFRLAQRRRGRLTLCHKTNILVHAGELYLEVLEEVGARFPDVDVDYVHVDAMCQHLPMTPERFDVVVTDNLFGDIISDLGATIQGGLGVACSGNLNPTRGSASMFESVHGSAPDIAGRGWANPAATVLSAALCLAWLGERKAAVAVEAAMAEVLGGLPALAGPEMGRSTSQIGDDVVTALTRGGGEEVVGLPGSIVAAVGDLATP